MKNSFAFLFGGLFSFGLMTSGMSNPDKVLGFLDIAGNWDPSLLFVMLGAIAVTIIPMQIMLRKAHPKTIYNETVIFPTSKLIDKKLLIGSTIFGIGWGISGICPAPGLTLIGLGYYQSLYFIISMVIGMLLYQKMTGGHS